MLRKLIILPVAFLAFACSKDKKVDDALNSDLTTAAQANPYTPQDSISAAERANALNGTSRTSAAPVRRTTTTTRRVSSSGGSGTYSAPTRTPTVQRNTKRDAAIGAAAGAVIGGVTTHSVKGGVIGAVTGGILGGVIGNNVDVKKKY